MRSRFMRGARVISAVVALALLGVLLVASPASAGKSKKEKQYSFTFVNGTVIEGVATSNTVFLPNAGGNDLQPTGMNVHVSCSDRFVGGFGQKDGPDSVRDTAWRIESYSIGEIKDGKFKLKCGESFVPPPPPGPPPVPAIDIVKTVNGEDANQAPGVLVNIGETVTLGYKVTNTGPIALSDVVVTDLDLGVIQCPKSSLAAGESMQCSNAFVDVTRAGHVFMKARVDAVGRVDAAVAPPVAGKGHGFAFSFVNGTVITGTSDKNTVFLPNAGGTSVGNPTGMTVHVSCSDKFVGGFGQKDGPEAGRDSAWQIASFSINKDKGKKTCGETFQTINLPVMAMDPVNYTAKPPTLPPPPECTIRVVADGDVKVSWAAVDGATSYAVKRNNVWLGRTSSVRFVDANPPRGERLEYFVRSISRAVRSGYTSCGSIEIPDEPNPPVCEINRINGTVVVSWSAVEGAKSYQVRQNGVWQVRTTQLSYVDHTPGDGYTVEAIFAGNVKGTPVSCGGGGS